MNPTLLWPPFSSSGLRIIHESQNDKSGFILSVILILHSKGRAPLCQYKSNSHTHTEARVWCFDLILIRCCFVCQLNNGLAGVKATDCHHYTPAVINPMCINVIIVETVYTPELCVSSCCCLLLPREGWLSSFSSTLTSGVPTEFSAVDTWAASQEQMRCKHCDQGRAEKINK